LPREGRPGTERRTSWPAEPTHLLERPAERVAVHLDGAFHPATGTEAWAAATRVRPTVETRAHDTEAGVPDAGIICQGHVPMPPCVVVARRMNAVGVWRQSLRRDNEQTRAISPAQSEAPAECPRHPLSLADLHAEAGSSDERCEVDRRIADESAVVREPTSDQPGKQGVRRQRDRRRQVAVVAERDRGDHLGTIDGRSLEHPVGDVTAQGGRERRVMRGRGCERGDDGRDKSREQCPLHLNSLRQAT